MQAVISEQEEEGQVEVRAVARAVVIILQVTRESGVYQFKAGAAPVGSGSTRRWLGVNGGVAAGGAVVDQR